nr:hypothetical protein [uncultured Chryseobacterium sp.]
MKRKSINALALLFSGLAMAQIGINTTNPLGMFHIDGSKDNSSTPTSIQQSNDFIVKTTGDTGIGITTLDPSAKLQINAADKGILIPRVSLTDPTDRATIALPAKGLMVYNTNINSSMDEGFYTNYGTPTSPEWTTYQKKDKNAWTFYDLYDTVAAEPIDKPVTVGTTVNNVDLGMAVSVTIPAHTQAKLITTYSVPLGTTLVDSKFGGYYGVRFLKNDTEFPAGSRKYTITILSVDGSLSRMSSVSATVGETLVNNTDSPIVINYALNGYVESVGTEDATIRFNMWSLTDPNYNWGRAYMSVQMFTKPL